MKEQTGAHIEMNKNSPHDAPTKQFFIKGTPEQIKAAKDEIAKIVGDGGSKCYPCSPPFVYITSCATSTPPPLYMVLICFITLTN